MVTDEVFKKVLRQRGEEAALQAVALMHRAGVLDVTSRLAMEAVKLSAEFELPMAGSLILATARACGAILWTQDAHFEGLPDIRFARK